MSRLTKTILATGIILLTYGYLGRMLNIYFFWDSKTFGVIILIIALLSYWMDLRKIRRRRGKKVIWVTIGICFIVFGLVISPYVIFKLKNSDAYRAAIEYLKISPEIKNDIGEVKGFGLIPTGSAQTTTINGLTSGGATFEIIVQGEKKYKDVTINLKKTPDTSWTVIDVK